MPQAISGTSSCIWFSSQVGGLKSHLDHLENAKFVGRLLVTLAQNILPLCNLDGLLTILTFARCPFGYYHC